MKRSQIALLAMGGVLSGIVIASVVSLRIALSHGDSAFIDAKPVSRATYLRGFDGIEVAGSWDVNLSRGDDWQIEISYPGGLEDRVDVHLQGDRLRLGIASHTWWDEPDYPVTADIVMPELEEVGLRGTARVDLRGFRGHRLAIDIAGAARLEGHDGHYDELDLSVAGASHIDLRDMTVTDADVDLAGASKVTLTMDGGVLSGSVAGTGSVLYYGAVSAETIRLAGIARVERVQ